MADPYTDAELEATSQLSGIVGHDDAHWDLPRLLATVDALKSPRHLVHSCGGGELIGCDEFQRYVEQESWYARAEAAEAERDRLRGERDEANRQAVSATQGFHRQSDLAIAAEAERDEYLRCWKECERECSELEAKRDAAEKRWEIARDNNGVLLKERDRLRKALNDTLDIIIWMSGSPSFGPDGEGHKHWVKVRDEELSAAFATLETL